MKKHQTGGTILGLIIGILIGLGAALAVAVYVTKVPVPFLTKSGGGRGADLDAAESQKNKNWDPNSPLYGKNPARPVTPPEPAADAGAAASGKVGAAPAAAGVEAAPKPSATPKPEAKAENKPESTEAAKPKADGKASASADPLGDLAMAKAAASGGADPFDYFVQAGAFRTQADADAQRAKLGMLGWQSKVTEREQNGRSVFRVRVGPFGKRDDAAQLKEKLDTAGVDAVLVRVQR